MSDCVIESSQEYEDCECLVQTYSYKRYVIVEYVSERSTVYMVPEWRHQCDSLKDARKFIDELENQERL